DPDKLVLDIRFNGGGNNTLIKPIIRGIIKLDNIDRPGHLFVITGRETFSAAQNLTNELENWTKVTFVGEPTGSHVNLYGDAKTYEMPNSKLPVRISELWWQNKHARDERKWTGPHLAAEPNFKDYKNNIDPAMEVIRNYRPLRPLREMAIESVQKNDVKSFLAKAKERLKDPLYKYQGSEDEINDFGYNLIQMKRFDDAIEVFKLNAELYPESSNVYDSLAESYMRAGNNELATKFYNRSLELNPNNTNAAEMIEKIKRGN
ncbi:MAG: tetratricopeptide repeat protein, partial [Acidobacteria bacterium]|nr:tetratricopeptide repeat protein [Acidobacteriota bacterium]